MNESAEISIQAYDQQAAKLSEVYNALNRRDINPGFFENLPISFDDKRLLAADLGCGSGSDAYVLAHEYNYEVVGVDSSEEMLRMAHEKKSHPLVFYMNDALPEIENLRAMDLKFNVFLMSAVWMHLNNAERAELVQNIKAIAAKDALFYVSLRHGDSPADRPMFPVSMEELEQLAKTVDASCKHLGTLEDKQGRGNVKWEYALLKL